MNILAKIRVLLTNTYFALILLLLIVVTLGSFVFTGPLGWAAGILYIAYDTGLLVYVAWKTSRTLNRLSERQDSPDAAAARPRIAVLIPARNECLGLPASIGALQAQTDPPEEIYVIDDGSTDGTEALLERRYGVTFTGKLGESEGRPRIMAWRKRHSGKSRSLNEVWPRVDAEVVVTIDADTILDPGAISAIRRVFGGDPNLAAACGVLAPKCRRSFSGRYFEMFQTFEYIRAFLSRLAWMQSNALLLVSGAFAAYRKDVLKQIGGYDPTSLVEDYDLIHRLHRHAHEHGLRWEVGIVAEARAETDAPNSVRTFLKQRQRWFSGFLHTQLRNRDMVGNPRYGPVGTLMLPIKSADTLQPIYGLVAFAILVELVVSRRGVPAFVLWIVGAKLALDLIFHFWSVYLYHRWQGEPVSASTWILASVATATEPITFQLLRHTGALLGWIGFLQGTNDWAPQRDLPTPAPGEPAE